MSSSKAIVRQRLRAALKELERGRYAAARPLLEQVLALDRGNPEASAYLGVALLHGGETERAVALLDLAAGAMPAVPWVHAHLGEACSQIGDPARAFEAYDRARTLQPGNAAYATGAASALAMHGRHDEAAAIFEEVLRRAPGDARAWYNLGTVRRDQGRMDDAVRCFSVAVDTQPDWVDARNSLGSALHALYRFEEAERHYRDCITYRPQEPSFRLNFASLLIDVGRLDEAQTAAEAVVARWPALAMGHSFLGTILTQQGKLRQALHPHARAAELDPTSVHFVEGHALALAHVDGWDAARPAFDRALSLHPDAHTVRHARALVLLGCGRLSQGWADYEFRPASRAASVGSGGAHRCRLLPDLAELNAGAVVRLVTEQGLGDELFFLRFARFITECGGHVVYGASARLEAFLQHVAEPVATFARSGQFEDGQDFMLIGDLPNAIHRMDLTAAPSATGVSTSVYPSPLRLDPSVERVRSIERRLRECGPPPYLALTWRAGVPPRQQGSEWTLHKSVPLLSLAEALRDVPGTLVCVQRHPEAAELQTLHTALGRALHDFSALNETLEDMLALLACVDEYICVSNTNTHIRAGTGRAARVLVPGPAEWRWPFGQTTSPWFPGFKVYHQDLCGDWSAALAALRGDLLGRS